MIAPRSAATTVWKKPRPRLDPDSVEALLVNAVERGPLFLPYLNAPIVQPVLPRYREHDRGVQLVATPCVVHLAIDDWDWSEEEALAAWMVQQYLFALGAAAALVVEQRFPIVAIGTLVYRLHVEVRDAAATDADACPVGGVLRDDDDHHLFCCVYDAEVNERCETVVQVMGTCDGWQLRYYTRDAPSMPYSRLDALNTTIVWRTTREET